MQNKFKSNIVRVSHLVALALVLFTPSVSLRLPASSERKAIDAPSLREDSPTVRGKCHEVTKRDGRVTLSVRTEGVSAVGLAPPSGGCVSFFRGYDEVFTLIIPCVIGFTRRRRSVSFLLYRKNIFTVWQISYYYIIANLKIALTDCRAFFALY